LVNLIKSDGRWEDPCPGWTPPPPPKDLSDRIQREKNSIPLNLK
jgi:hypothetical protein